ncbi:MAG: hypothetical protein ABIG63_17520 [Chloroflexota bacterium]
MQRYDIRESLAWEVTRHRGHQPIGGREPETDVWILAAVVWLGVVCAVAAQYWGVL